MALHGPWYDAIIYCRGCQANDTQCVWVMCLMRGARLERESTKPFLSFVVCWNIQNLRQRLDAPDSPATVNWSVRHLAKKVCVRLSAKSNANKVAGFATFATILTHFINEMRANLLTDYGLQVTRALY